MKTLDSIPTHKIERATKLVSTGVKIGGNYLRYYGEKLIRGEEDKDKLNANNAKDIYDGLKIGVRNIQMPPLFAKTMVPIFAAMRLKKCLSLSIMCKPQMN